MFWNLLPIFFLNFIFCVKTNLIDIILVLRYLLFLNPKSFFLRLSAAAFVAVVFAAVVVVVLVVLVLLFQVIILFLPH